MPEKLETQKDSQQELLYATRSEEVQEIMGRMPSWIVRRGITLMAVILLGLLVLAWFFKYPDMIEARVTIASENPPVELIARSSLPIQSLQVRDAESVVEGQLLCILSNPADYQDVEAAADITRMLDTSLEIQAVVPTLRMPQVLNLGELQAAYVTLSQAVYDYQFFLQHHSYGVKIDQLKAQTVYQSKLTQALMDRTEKVQQQLAIQEQRYALDSSLVAATIMSRVEYEQALKELIGQQMNSVSSNSELQQSRLRQKEIAASLTEARIQWETEAHTHEQAVRQAARQFNAALAQWEQNYVVRSPIAGKVSFFRYWKENQFVQAGTVMMTVTPALQPYLVRGEVGVRGSGKIKAGQLALIKLSAYPFQEFGSLKAEVASRSIVPMDSTFAIQLRLTNGLHTNAGKLLPDQAQMNGIAEIITEDKSFFDRLFENIYGKIRR